MRLSVIAEVALVLVGGALAARWLSGALSLPVRADRNAVLFEQATPDWLLAAKLETIQVIVRYSITLGIALGICVWVGRPTRRQAGLSSGGHPVGRLMLFGALMGVLLGTLGQFGQVAQQLFNIGSNTPFWDLMWHSEWTISFWLFMAASSFILIPIVEELFFRAYALGRFREHFSSGGAVLVCALLFWVSHGQYITLDPLLAYYSVLAFVSASVMAWSVIHTGSIIPAVIAHTIVNLPMNLLAMFVFCGSGVLLLLLYQRLIIQHLKSYFSMLRETREWLLLVGLVPVMFSIALLVQNYPKLLPVIVLLLVLIAAAGVTRRPEKE